MRGAGALVDGDPVGTVVALVDGGLQVQHNELP